MASSRVCRATMPPMSWLTALSSVTSTVWPSRDAALVLAAFFNASNSAGFRYVAITLAPALRNARLTACPKPPVPPATNTILSFIVTALRCAIWLPGCGAISANPATTEDSFAGVKHGGLAGRDGALRLAERDARGGLVDGFDLRVGRLVAIADADLRFNGRGRGFERNPVHVAHFAGGRAQVGIFANDQAIHGAIEFHHVHGPANRDAEALALSHRVMAQAAVTTENFA